MPRMTHDVHHSVDTEPLLPLDAIEERLGFPSGFLSRRLRSQDPPPVYRFSRKTVLGGLSAVARWRDAHAATRCEAKSEQADVSRAHHHPRVVL